MAAARPGALFGHSHGGSFVIYALFAEVPSAHTFATYLPSDSSLECMDDTAKGWEQAYASSSTDLPVRLFLSWAIAGNRAVNDDFARVIAQRNYQHLTYVQREYGSDHLGIVPMVLADNVPFAIAAP